MSEKAPTRLSRFPWWFWAVMAGLFVLFVVVIGWFLNSPVFEDIVRDRVIAQIQKATGGTVELQSLHWNVKRLEIEANGLTIRGLEPAGDVPLAHADRLYVKLRVVSFLNTSVDLNLLTLEQPEIHLIVKEDGSTNVPGPQVKTSGDPIQQLFDIAVGRVELHNGSLLVNEQKLPLDFKANDVGLTMDFQRLQRRYDGTLHVGKIDTQYQDYRDVAASADAEFSLWQNRIQVRSLKLVSEKSSIDLSGTIDDFNHPRVQLTYGATIDLAQLAAITRQYNLRGGGLNVTGSGDFAHDNFTATGKLVARGVNYQDQSFSLRDASAGADFAADRDHILLKKISAHLLGGTVTGDAEVKNYAPPLAVTTAQVRNEKSGKNGKPSANGLPKSSGALPVQQGAANFKVSGASLTEVVRTLSSKALPLDKLNATGAVNGTVGLAWKESIAHATAELALDATAPAQSATDQLPVSGALLGRYDVHTGLLAVSQLNLATPHSEANASGELGARDLQLKLGVTTSNLNEFQPLLSAIGQSPPPIELNGRASFNGTVSGKVAYPDIAGRLLATDFSYVFTPTLASVAAAPHPSKVSTVESLLHVEQHPPEQKPQPKAPRIHVDSFAGDVQYGRNKVAVHNGVIEQGGAQLNVDGSATLVDGSFTADSPFEVRAAIHNGSVADLQRTLGTNYPVSGVMNFSLQASGTENDEHGHGQLSVSGGEAYGHPIKTLTSDIVLENHEVAFNNIRVQALSGTVAGTAAYNPNSRQVRTDLRGDNIDLEKLTELQTVPLQERGTASFTLKTSGTLDQPMVEAHVEVANLVFNDEYQGGLILDAVTHGSKLQISTRSNFAKATLALDGTVDLKGDMESDLRLQFSQLDIDPLLSAGIKGRITGHSAMAGSGSLTGPLRKPRALKGTLQVDSFAVTVEKIPIHSDGPFQLALADQVISVQRLTVAAQDTSFSVGGTVDLKADRPLNLYAKGHVNLGLVHVLDSEIDSYGSTDADITVRGTVAKPVMNGRVVIAHAGFSVIDLPASLGELNGTLVFNQDRLEVERLTGLVGGGQVNVAGYITYGNTIGFDLTANGTDIRFRYGGVSLTADQSLHLNGTLRGSTLSGDITITRFAQIPSMEMAAAFATPNVEVPNPTSPLNNLRLDVRIVSAPELTVQTSLAKLSGDADLRLRGTAMRPVLLGRINIAEGDINLNGTKYHLDRGDITFANPIRIDPILDMEATTRVRDFDITIGLHGTMEKLTTTYRSDPPLSSDDIIALLAFGRTQEERYAAGGTSTTSLGEGAGGMVLGQLINQTVSNRVSRLFGVSSIRINPSVGGADNNPSARLTIEQQVSKDVTLTYITNLTQSAQQVIQFEYNINTEYTLQGVRDENGVVSFDLLIRKRKK
ncbi:MAG TPA: translocation/assembly module TamB domain-containing protein [Terriglobales bacterium]